MDAPTRLDNLLRLVLPLGHGVLLMLQLHADETVDDDSGLLTVAGYLIGDAGLRALVPRWASALGPLEYFHMREGHHYKYPDIYSKLISLITHDYFIAGFSSSVLKGEYNSVTNQRIKGQTLRYWFGGPYSFCVGAIIDLANKWLDDNNPNERDVAYIFDGGNEREGEADYLLKQILKDPLLSAHKRRLRMYSRTFIDSKRKEHAALQAADILAWNMNAQHRSGVFPVDALGILLGDTRKVHYSRSAIVDTIEAQMDFCDFYGDLRHATSVKPQRGKTVS